jgi:hypothetical protein
MSSLLLLLLPLLLRLQHQHSDDDSDVLLRRGTVLYDFNPEEEDEVAVSKGEAVDIEYEVGGWIQVGKGARGRVRPGERGTP